MLKALCVLMRRTVWHTLSEPTSCSWDRQMSRAQKVPAGNKNYYYISDTYLEGKPAEGDKESIGSFP